MLNLKDIISALTDQVVPHMDFPISNATVDSRKVTTDGLFIALPGDKANGHDFVEAAFNNGAALALIDQDLSIKVPTLDLRPGYFQAPSSELVFPLSLRVEDSLLALQAIASYWRDQFSIRTIGITGSVGKTSTKELTAALLSEKYAVLKNPGNFNNEIGLPLTLLELKPRHQVAVLEMGFYVAGEIQTLCDIAKPQVGVITNIGTVHAERAGSQAHIYQGKAELVQYLPSNGVAILNMDDPWVQKMIPLTTANVFTYGIKEKSDLMAEDIQSYGLDGMSCVLVYQGKKHPIRTPLLGAFSIYTILCATAVALTEGVDWETITKNLAHSRLDLRLHPITLPNGTTILDDTYNASPESTIAALNLLQSLPGRRVAVLGDMLELGQYEISGHRSVGLAAASSADILILIGDRTKTIAEAALSQGFSKKALFWFTNSAQTALQIESLISSGDFVLIKGSNSMRMDRVLKALMGGAS